VVVSPEIRSPEVVSTGCHSIRPMTNKTLTHGLSEKFLAKLGFYYCDCSKRSSFLNDLGNLDNHIRDTERLHIKLKSTYMYLSDRSDRYVDL